MRRDFFIELKEVRELFKLTNNHKVSIILGNLNHKLGINKFLKYN